MKRSISILLCITLILGSVSLCFAATQDVSDSATHTLLQSLISQFTQTGGVNADLNTLINDIRDIYNVLVWSSGEPSNNIVSYVKSIDNATSIIANNLADASGNGIATILNNIFNELVTTTSGGAVVHFITNLNTNVNTIKNLTSTISGAVTTINTNVADIGTEILSSFPVVVTQTTQANTNLGNIYTLENNTLPGIYAYAGSIDGTLTTYQPYLLSLYNLDNVNAMGVLSGGSAITIRTLNQDGTVNENIVNLSAKNWRDNIAYLLWNQQNSLTRGMGNIAAYYGDTQTRTSWLTNTSQTYTPSSLAKGLYYWLASIQTPIARLAYVHASDQEIQAREKAASNQAQLVNNFIDSNGSGAVPSTSFGSLASISNSYKTNFSSTAQPSGIFDIFNSDHGTWFSQETANQLDSTTQTRGSSFETPLLDRQLESIYNALGGEEQR